MPVEDYNAFEGFKLQSLHAKLVRSSAQAKADRLYDGEQVFDELIKISDRPGCLLRVVIKSPDMSTGCNSSRYLCGGAARCARL